MFEIIPKEIKRVFKISFLLTIVVVIFGIIIKRPELWFAFFIGSVASIINSYYYYLLYIKLCITKHMVRLECI